MRPSDIEKHIRQVLGISVQSSKLRHWEDYGLIPRVKRVGKGAVIKQRDFSKEELDRIIKVICLKAVGLTNREVKLKLANGNGFVNREILDRLNAYEYNIIPYIKKVMT